MAIKKISEREDLLSRQVQDLASGLNAMEDDRDALLERINTHECAGPVDIFLEERLANVNRTLEAVQEDFDHLDTLAKGFEAQRDEAREDLVIAAGTIAAAAAPREDPVGTLSSNGHGAVRRDGARDTQENERPTAAQILASTAPSKTQFDEAIRQRNEAIQDRDDMKVDLDRVLGEMDLLREDDATADREMERESYSDCYEALEATREERETLRRELVATVEAYTELERDRDGLRREVEKLNGRNHTQSASICTLRTERDALEHDLQTAKDERNVARRGREAALETVKRLVARRDEAYRAARLLRSERDELQRKAEELLAWFKKGEG